MKTIFAKAIFLSCLIALFTISQNIYGQQRCNGNGWTEKIIRVGEPNTFVDFLAGSVTFDITDGNGKSTSTGGYLKIYNYGDQPIEWVTYGNSPYYPIAPSGSGEMYLPIYRTKNDLTPTKATVVLHYCSNTKATYPTYPSGNSQSSGNPNARNQSQSNSQSGSSKSLSDIIVGCWRLFPNGGTDNELGLQMDSKFTAEGESISMSYKAGGKVYPPEDYIKNQKVVYTIKGNKLTLINKTADPSSLHPIVYEFDDEKFFVLDDDGNRTKQYSIKITCGEPFK